MESPELIDYCRQFVQPDVELASDAMPMKYVEIFDSHLPDLNNDHQVNIFTFHTSVPESASKISLPDVAVDHGAIDYDVIVEEMIRSALAFQPDAHVFFVTDTLTMPTLEHARVSVIRLPLEREFPMYERVQAMWAYAHSSLYQKPTVFLDSDAFINKDISWVFHEGMDIAVTYRGGGLMPINEGVFFVNSLNVSGIQSFFNQYLYVYNALIADPVVKEIYGDVRRWRGGQLSLNAVTCPLGVPSPLDRAVFSGAIIEYHPCHELNFSFDYSLKELSKSELASKSIIHLKGGRKVLLSQLIAIQDEAGRTQENISSSHVGELRSIEPSEYKMPLNPSDRRYSLDSTPPEDFEPAYHLAYEDETLTAIADHFKTDKGSLKHNYTKIYEQYLEHKRDIEFQLVEIGVACGSSLKAWSKYFPKAKIAGMDIREACSELCQGYPQIEIIVADATKISAPYRMDVFIDDGSHVSQHIVDTFRLNWPLLKAGGLYFIEDLKCTHNPRYPDLISADIPKHLFGRDHFMQLIDELLKEMDWRESNIEYIHFYKELVVLKKLAQS